MKGQISLFDWMPPEQPSFDDVQEPEAVRLIGDALGLTFRYDERFQEWTAKAGKLKCILTVFHIMTASGRIGVFLGSVGNMA